MFRTVPLSIIRSFSLYTQQWCMSYRFVDCLRAGSGRNWFHPDPARKLSANLYRVRNEEVLLRVKEQRNILHEIRKRQANWIGHILGRNCLLQGVYEGKTVPLSIIRSFSLYTQQWYMSDIYTTYICVCVCVCVYADSLNHKLSAKLYDVYHCCVYSEKLLMMDRGTVRNM